MKKPNSGFPRHAQKLPARKAVAERTASGHLYRLMDVYRNSIDVPERKEFVIELESCEWLDTASDPMELHQWTVLTARINRAKDSLSKCVNIDPLIMGGVPVIKGTRMPVGMVLANIAADMKLSEIADDCDLDKQCLVMILQSFASAIDRPVHEHYSARRMHAVQAADKVMCSRRQNIDSGVSEGIGWEVD